MSAVRPTMAAACWMFSGEHTCRQRRTWKHWTVMCEYGDVEISVSWRTRLYKLWPLVTCCSCAYLGHSCRRGAHRPYHQHQSILWSSHLSKASVICLRWSCQPNWSLSCNLPFFETELHFLPNQTQSDQQLYTNQAIKKKNQGPPFSSQHITPV